MKLRRRRGDSSNRSIAPPGSIGTEVECKLAQARYRGSPHHKSKPADYGFHPPASPRAHKSLCDELKPIRLCEATRLFRAGIRLGMVSRSTKNGLPKQIWAVDDDEECYEAVQGGEPFEYHGYRLDTESPARRHIVREWRKRRGE